MNRIRLPLLVVGILSSSQWPMGVHVAAADGKASRAHVLVLDVAADCRTWAPTTARGETNMVAGKIFPRGTLPNGAASNDPILPVNGVEPIGDWHHRSQNVLPLPADIAHAYGSAPGQLATFYFFLDDGRALVSENWGAVMVNGIPSVLGVITGGFGGFSGAAGDARGTILGTNATGCPNARTRFNIRPGSTRGAWPNGADGTIEQDRALE